ncbi:MAG: rhodanese-like domain-containing protein [Planctomycetota bacterium]
MYLKLAKPIGAALLVLTGIVAIILGPTRTEALSNVEKQEKLASLYQRYKAEFPSVREISPRDLKAWRMKDKVVIVDGCEPEERAVSMISDAVTLEEFSNRKPSRIQKPVVFYCTAGYRSTELAKQYAEQGYETYNLRQGILGWLYEDLPIVADGEKTNVVHVYGPQWNLAPDRYQTVW